MSKYTVEQTLEYLLTNGITIEELDEVTINVELQLHSMAKAELEKIEYYRKLRAIRGY